MVGKNLPTVIDVAPQPGGQALFLAASAYEVLFGGQAGPGKTWALVIDALGLQFEATPLGRAAYEVPAYRAVLFRRETKQLARLLDEAKNYYPDFGATYTAQRVGDPGPCFSFPSGAKIFLCHLELEQDKENHQGQEYQYVGFDELTQFSLTQYLYLFSRCRSKIPHLYARMRSTTNPTGPGLVWVKKRFVQNQQPHRVKYFVSTGRPEDDPRGKEVHFEDDGALSRVFIPGKLSENRILHENDPGYADKVKAMGTQYERALLQGDWDAFGGDLFAEYNRSTMVISPFEIPSSWRLFASIDPGYSSPCSFSLRAVDVEGNIYRILTYYERERSPEEHAKAIKDIIHTCTFTAGRMPEFIVSGRDAFAKKDRYAVIASDKTFADVFREFGLFLREANTDRILGWWAMRDMMKRGKWFVFDGFNQPLLDELVGAVRDDKQPEDLMGRGNDPSVPDHSLDEERYGVMAVFRPAKPAPTQIGWAEAFAKKAKKRTGWKVGRG